MGMCSLATTMIMIFTIFMWIVVRQRPRPIMRYWIYMRLHWQPVVEGFLYLIIPVFSYMIVISVLMRGHILSLKIFSLTEDCLPKDNCAITYFDRYFKLDSLTYLKARAGRIGILLIMSGVYQISISTEFNVLSKQQQVKDKTDYMGNLLQPKRWQKSL